MGFSVRLSNRPTPFVPQRPSGRATPFIKYPEAGGRLYPRFEIEIEVAVVIDSVVHLGLTANLSEGGLFLATRDVSPRGTRATLTVCLPDTLPPFGATGEVRWVRAHTDESREPAGMGIQFDPLPPEEAGRVRAFLLGRDALFVEEEPF